MTTMHQKINIKQLMSRRKLLTPELYRDISHNCLKDVIVILTHSYGNHYHKWFNQLIR